MDVIAIIKLTLRNWAEPDDLGDETLLQVTQALLEDDFDSDDFEVLAVDFIGEPKQLSLDSALQAQELRAVESFFKGGLS